MSLSLTHIQEPESRLAARLILTALFLCAAVITLWSTLEARLLRVELPHWLVAWYTLRGILMTLLILAACAWVLRVRRREALEVDAAFRLFVETTSDAVIGANQAGVINYTNFAALRMFGHESLLGRPLTVLMPVEYHRAHRAGMVRYLAPPHVTRIIGKEQILQGVRADGTVFPLALTVTALRGKRVQFFGYVRSLSNLAEAAEYVVRA